MTRRAGVPLLLCATLLMALCITPVQVAGGPRLRALVYHETTGYRHASIPYAIQRITAYGQLHGVEVTADQTSTRFTHEGLAPFDVVVWLSTVGGVRGDGPLLTGPEWAAFQRYMERGGGYAGIHAASDCCDESACYGELLGNGARFANHPSGVGGSPGCLGAFPGDFGDTSSCFQAVVITESNRHPSTWRLPARRNLSDELYNFQANPRGAVHVLQRLDEASYDFQPHPYILSWGTLMGGDHPITWCKVQDGARVWYTGLGHDAATFADDALMTMIIEGIRWAAGSSGLHGCGQVD